MSRGGAGAITPRARSRAREDFRTLHTRRIDTPGLVTITLAHPRRRRAPCSLAQNVQVQSQLGYLALESSIVEAALSDGPTVAAVEEWLDRLLLGPENALPAPQRANEALREQDSMDSSALSSSAVCQLEVLDLVLLEARPQKGSRMR
jgi:hypothetical protein